MEYNSTIKSVSAFAPATCANVAVGFDLLGFAFSVVGDQVTLTRSEQPGIKIDLISSEKDIPLAADKNVAAVVIQKCCIDFQLDCGFTLSLKKGIPLSSGMGGSAASAVAALTAFNGFLANPLPIHELIEYAIGSEEFVSGTRHADNVVPCMYGGMTLTRSQDPLDVIHLPIPKVFCVLVNPKLRVDTRHARDILPKEMPLVSYVQQSANLACFIAALYQNNLDLLQKSLQDVLIEPLRSSLVIGFNDVKNAALNAGALGVSLSGSGPTLFAFAKTEVDAKNIAKAMQEAFMLKDIDSRSWISPISEQAAYIVEKDEVKNEIS